MAVAKALFHKHWLPDEACDALAETVGVGRFRSYVDETFSSKTSRRVAHFWNKATDQEALISTALYYAEKLGYKTGDEILQLVRDARADRKSKAFEDLSEIKERTNKAMVQLDNHLARARIPQAHLVRVPVAARQVLWSLRTLIERPAKSYFLAAVGDDAQGDIEDFFLDQVPRWIKKGGYVPLGFDNDGNPKLSNPASPGLWADLSVITDPDLDRSLGPLGQIALRGITGRDAFGAEYPSQNDYAKWLYAIGDVFTQLPQFRATRKPQDEQGAVIDITKDDAFITRLRGAMKDAALTRGGIAYLFLGPAFTARTGNKLAIQADWYSELNDEQRAQVNHVLLDQALVLQEQALARNAPAAVKAAANLFLDRAEFDRAWEKEHGRDASPLEKTVAHIHFYNARNLVTGEQAAELAKQAAKEPSADALEEFRQDLFDKYGDPGGAWRNWHRDLRLVHDLSNAKVVQQRVDALASDGLLDAESRKVEGTAKGLRPYARAALGWKQKNDEWQKRLGDPLLDTHERDALWQQYRAWLDDQDRPVQIGDLTLPSPARVNWAKLPENTRREITIDRATRRWDQFSSFDKQILSGTRPSPEVAKGWALYEETIADYKAKQPAGERKLARDQILDVVQQIDNYYPGFKADWQFSQKPAFMRLKSFRVVRDSVNSAGWDNLFENAQKIWVALKSDDYKGQTHMLRDAWADYAKQVRQWTADNDSAFDAELRLFEQTDPEFIAHLLSR